MENDKRWLILKFSSVSILIGALIGSTVHALSYKFEIKIPTITKNYIDKECTEVAPSFFTADGWERLHESDYFTALALQSQGKANIRTHIMKCRWFYNQDKGTDFDLVWENQLWWRKI